MKRLSLFLAAILIFAGCDSLSSNDETRTLRIDGEQVVTIEDENGDPKDVEVNFFVRKPAQSAGKNLSVWGPHNIDSMPLEVEVDADQAFPAPDVDTVQALHSYQAVVDGEVVDEVQVNSRSDLEPVSFE